MDKRHALCILFGTNRFNYRTAGVILRNGHVLVCREDDKDFTMLPGGRVELGEASDIALKREITEELGCSGRIGRLIFSVENFFALTGEQFHEIGKYYSVTLPDDFPFETEKPCMITHDEGHVLTFNWVKLEAGALAGVNLLPKWLRTRFDGLPAQTEHLIVDER
ncbi:hypothetical protein MNBD_ALPHA12-1175 [hydrothermal vent metagenome]|uniref:Nudix hydrolase domain-containing protein n=1 Tax=hydrothermal vent metagenome TaxID=652676 RepID=A0A3B0UC30_9ZZZZ